IYIPKLNEQSQQLSAKIVLGDQTASSGFSSDNIEKVNINTASLSQLDSLPGIGPTYAQNIIEQRPYSNTTELVSKGAIKQSLYDKIKDKISIY
ncbi:MAG TPA: helix-hairpin-helix domain-containing protein, partial [Patescibacteria group bacterium]|nr:helix-hairpin-helix domain-containing protein [Patescibacteria group bacterium]